MSFVQRLRMANMFPIRSGMGNARINVSGPDDMYKAIEAGKDLALWERDVLHGGQQSGLQTVGEMGRESTLREPLKFGGVTEQSNPGADILARSRQSARDTYEGYKKPQITAGQVLAESGIKPNVQFPDANEEMDRDLNRRFKESQITKNITDNKKLKVVTITDPNDPTKQISANYDDETGTVTPIKLPEGGRLTSASSPKDIQAKIDADKQKQVQSQSVKTKAQTALDVLNQITDETPEGKEKLKSDTELVTGWSANFGTKYTPKGASAVADIERLRNMLTLDLIGEMKAQSKTGATGFGQMNLKELGVLENAASKLNARNMDESAFAEELGRIREHLNKIIQPDSTETESKVETKVETNNAPQAPPGWKYVRNATNTGWTALKIKEE